MKLPFLSTEKLVIGLDIGSHSIKVCELKKTESTYSVVNLGSIILPEGAVYDGTLHDPEVVGTAITELLANLKIKHKKVAISISGYSVIIKKIHLAVMEEKQLEEYINAEAEQYIPFDIDDVYLDFQDLKTNTEGSNKTEIMLVAAKKEIIDDYLDMLQGVGLQPVLVDVDGFALENIYESTHPQKENVALVDIGASKMNINIISNGISVAAKDIVLGSRQLTEQIADTFDIAMEEAEALKIGLFPAQEKQGQIAKIFSATCAQWALEIKKTIDLYHSNTANKKIDKLVLSGGGSKVAGLTDFLQRETDMPVEIFNPFARMIVNPKQIDSEYLNNIGPEMAIATGLAIRTSAL
ncbi:MAG: pilus assembly protein PilM [Desulfoarculaceae bacterium]|nr:pilus assembly protein PilM [Desulfoarculaceae bacterium]